MSRKSPPESSGPTVPAYIVTFSDMVTLLLTFFVMLLSLANMQDPELFDKSRDAFVSHINSYGLGALVGKRFTQQFSENKIRYRVKNPDEDPAVRTIDAREENLAQIFKKVAESMKTEKSKIVAKSADFKMTNISFSPGQVKLNDPAKKYLKQFAANLELTGESGKTKVYVLGTAKDGNSSEKQWILSAQRAQCVADFLTNSLSSDLQCPVYSWGAGPGGCWITPDSPISGKSQIMISILRSI